METKGQAGTAEQVLATCEKSRAQGRAFRDLCMAQLDRLDGFDWSGVYVLEGDTLVLETFVGAPTEHTRIPVGQGVCGTAVAQDKDQIIDDVSKLENYLSCSLETKAEAVVLIKKDGRTLGQIDIDSHRAAAFGPREVALLEALAALMADRWAEPAQP